VLTSRDLAPIDKLIRMVQVQEEMIKNEIEDYWSIKMGVANFKVEMERGDRLSIMIYILAKAKVEDLRAQLVLITEFLTCFVKDGFTKISASF